MKSFPCSLISLPFAPHGAFKSFLTSSLSILTLLLALDRSSQAQQLIADGVSQIAPAGSSWNGLGNTTTPAFSALNSGVITAEANVILVNNGSGVTAPIVVGASVRSGGVIEIKSGGTITTTGIGVDISGAGSSVQLNAVDVSAGYRGMWITADALAEVTNSSITVSGLLISHLYRLH